MTIKQKRAKAFRIELADCENVLLDSIATPSLKRKDIAVIYRMTIMSSEFNLVNWKKVNEAIIARWSMAGLKYIKDRAWRA